MHIADAETLALTIMEPFRAKLDGWSLGFDNAKRRCGCTSFSTRTITLSRHFVQMNDEDAVRDTVLHEIAHALAGAGAEAHGRLWKGIARQIGARPERCASGVAMPQGNVEGVCRPDCTARHNRHRMPPKRLLNAYQCTRCYEMVTWVIVK